jgi:NapC/NirT cytochrome c family, N-terminal region
MKMSFGRKTMMGAIGTIVAAGIGLMVLAAAGIAGWEYSNSDHFCANVCHQVHPEESIIHKQSVHARVQCVECHMGRLSTLHMLALKPTHVNELWGMIVGYERPVGSHTLRPSRDNCEACHWPAVEHHDSIAVRKRFDVDEKSSESITRLTLHTATGVAREGISKGIHWHIENDVSFKSPTAQAREIPWVRVTRKDGSTSTFIDPTSKVTAEELGKIEPRRIECYDCHNNVGHPFQNPARVVDDAIATGRVDRSLPSVKARSEAIIAAAGDFSGPRAEREKKIDAILAENSTKANVKPELQAKEKQFLAEMRKIMLDRSFEAKGFSWKSFASHTGHLDTEGCFRCHDGKHLNEKGESIRLQCTLCHDLPKVTLESGKGTVPSTVVAGVTPPSSHEEPNFMHEHRFKVDESCTMCHGKLEFGREGGNFCANPACHGRQWPGVNLNVEAKAAAPAPAAVPAAAATKTSAPAAPDKAKAEKK